MIKSESNINNVQTNNDMENVCDLKYLTEMMGGKSHLINEIMDVFLVQVPEELQSIKDAIIKTDYSVIRKFAHTMKSSVSIMGISALTPILQEMEDLGVKATDIERIKLLNYKLNEICKHAILEIVNEKKKYV